MIEAWERVQSLLNRSGASGLPEDADAVFTSFQEFLQRKDLHDLTEESLAQIGNATGLTAEALMIRHLEQDSPHDLDRSIDFFEKAVQLLPDSDSSKTNCVLRLAGGFALRSREKDDADFRSSVAWYERGLQAVSTGPVRAQFLYGLGALYAETFKRSDELVLLETAIDRFIEALQCSDHEQTERQLIVKGLGGALAILTLRVRDPMKTMERWQKAFYAVPFRSLDQQELKSVWHIVFRHRSDTDNPPPPSFIQKSRTRLNQYAPFNARSDLRATAAKRLEPKQVHSYSELQQAIELLRQEFAGALLVFRGQTDFHDGVLSPSMARKNAREEERLLWVAAVAENLRYGRGGVEEEMRTALGLPTGGGNSSWKDLDPHGPEGQAVLQHYGARTHFIDVTTSVDVALWFAHFRFRLRRDLFSRDELVARGARWAEDDPVPEYDTAWYEPAWSADRDAWGYLFVVVPRLPASGESLLHGEYIDLSACQSRRMRAQQAGLLYFDPNQKLEGVEAVAVYKFRLPLEGSPTEVLNDSVERLFPSPEDDALYSRILFCTPFCAEPERPGVLVRRLRIPEYHSAPASKPAGDQWGDWLAFRGGDIYVKPGLLFLHLLKDPWSSRCEVEGRSFSLSEAIAVVPSFPSMVIPAAIPHEGATLNLKGRAQVFLEYDPMSTTLSPRSASHHFTQQIIRRYSEVRASIVPFPGVRGAWVIQIGAVYWCRVFAQPDDGNLISTSGRAFGYDRQYGWVVKDGPSADTVDSAIEMRAERAAFYHVLGIAEHIEQGSWRLAEVAGSPYHRLLLLEGVAQLNAASRDHVWIAD